MLLNTPIYDYGLPLRISVCDVQEYPVHYHHDLEFVFVLEGTVIMKNGCTTVTLSQGDVHTTPPMTLHGIRGLEDDNVLAIIHVKSDYLQSHFPDTEPYTFRTLLRDRQCPDLGWLRELLLQLISCYFRMENGYIDNCSTLLHRIITLISDRFVFFSIAEKENVGPALADKRSVERMMRVFQYIMANLDRSASLSDLAEQENLSTFYLSHLIKEHTGCSFRDLISFLRAERSEIPLLEGEMKISRIAKVCGFSTSKYYESAFQKWYNTTPEEHFATYRHMLLEVTNLPRMDYLRVDTVLETVSDMTFRVIAQNRMVSSLNVKPAAVYFYTNTQRIRILNYDLTITMDLEDLHLMRALVSETLDSLQCTHAILYQRPQDDPEEIRYYAALMMEQGITVTISQNQTPPQCGRYGNDTLAGPISLLIESFFQSDSHITIPLRDHAEPGVLINGGKGIFTPSGVHKPMYDLLFVVTRRRWNLMMQGKHYSLMTTDELPDTYLIIVSNTSDEILRLCHEEGTPHATEDAIKNFHEELDLRFSLDIKPGTYSMRRYTYTHHSSFFHLLAEVDFKLRNHTTWRFCNNFLFSPHAEGRIVNVEETLDVDVILRGLSSQLIFIQKED